MILSLKETEVYLLFKQIKHTYMRKISTVKRKNAGSSCILYLEKHGADFLSANVFWWFSTLLKIGQYLLVRKERFRPYEESPCWS